MAFVASNGLTEADTSKTIAGGGHDGALPRHRRRGAGALPALLRAGHDGVDHLPQDRRRAVAALPMHPRGPAQLQQDGAHRVPRGCPRRPGAHGRRPHGRARHRAGALRRKLAGRAIVHGRRHHVPGPDRQVRDGRLAHRHGWRPLPDGESALGGQPGHARGDRRSHPREHPPLPARAHRRREPGHRRAGGLHPPGAHVVARLRGGAARSR